MIEFGEFKKDFIIGREIEFYYHNRNYFLSLQW